MTAVTSTPVSDAFLLEALESAHLPSLLAAVGLITGSDSVPRLDRYRPAAPQGGMTREQQDAAKAAILPLLQAIRDGRAPDPRTDRAAVAEMLRPILGESDFGDYLELSLEELAIDRPDPRAPAWRASDGAVDVAIIGAGLFGLLAAHRLSQAGVPFTIYERSPDLGGTWLDNSYPGCRVDVPSHVYSYSCLGDAGWADHFSERAAVHAALREFAHANGLLEHIRFGVEVESATFDSLTLRWRLRVGPEEVDVAVVVSATGQLSRPSLPGIPGDFGGPAFHSAAWDHDAAIDGARVAVVGTGASAIQIVPAIAGRAGHVSVFQRNATWLLDTPELREPFDAGQRWLERSVPTYRRWYRLWLQREVFDGILPFSRRDPAWDDPRSVSAINGKIREGMEAYLIKTFGADSSLLADVTPSYPPFAKRVIRDDGAWGRTLSRDDVSLVTAPIEHLDTGGIVTADGEHHAVDIIVYATGFRASDYLVPMRVTGRAGVDLHEHWAGDASAYLGATVPGFPNLFVLYGPNTNVVVSGSAVVFAECQATYLLEYVRTLGERGGALDCRPGVLDGFRQYVDALSGEMAWGCANVSNWYTNAKGRVSQAWPSTVLEYWQRTRALDPSDYEFLEAKDA